MHYIYLAYLATHACTFLVLRLFKAPPSSRSLASHTGFGSLESCVRALQA